jgi:hypothetical protein
MKPGKYDPGEMMKAYWTCSRCGKITQDNTWLDAKPICEVCMYKAQHGNDVFTRCEARGYHETFFVSQTQRWSSRTTIVELQCVCRKSAFLRIPDDGEYPPPKRWTEKDGVPTFIQSANAVTSQPGETAQQSANIKAKG